MIKFNIFTTDSCNLDCTYCYEGTKGNKIMTINTADNFLNFMHHILEINNENEVSINFHGGEPLLAFKIIKYIVNKINTSSEIDATFSMTTNGTVINDDIIKFIAENINNLSISIDGKKYSHNRNRIFKNGKGSFDTVINNSKKILKVKPNCIARMTITPETVCNLYENIIYIIDIGFKEIIFELDFMNKLWNKDLISLYNHEVEKILIFISNLNRNGKNIDIPLFTFAKNKRRNSKCDGGISSFSIDANGDIYPCIMVVKKKYWLLGNVFEGILNSSLIKEIEDIGNNLVEDCIGCKRYNYCENTRCKLINWAIMGEYNTPVPLICTNQHIALKVSKDYEKMISKV